VAPALEKYAQGPLAGLWKRPGLTPRDRSIVTAAALIARNQTIEMPHYFNLALDNGVKPREISEIITHLAFYSGWENAMSAVAVAKVVFADRKIGADQLPAASPSPLPLDKEAEAKRATSVEQQFGSVAQGIVQYTSDVLFRDLWLRPDLAPRDRSLVTVSALIAFGQVAQSKNCKYDNNLRKTCHRFRGKEPLLRVICLHPAKSLTYSETCRQHTCWDAEQSKPPGGVKISLFFGGEPEIYV
jgi:4-carboxymuconolactone decarboxylase